MAPPDGSLNGTPNGISNGHHDVSGRLKRANGTAHTNGHHLDTASEVNGVRRCEPIAICGMACRLPGGINCPQGLWDFLMRKEDARGPVPEKRYNASSHFSSHSKPTAINSEHGYFLDEDIDVTSLDTSFFSLTKSELEQTDPQQRQLLEVARECIDDAGEVNWRGSKIGVYAGSFGEDWAEIFTKDSQQYGGYRSTAASDMALSNRVSYEMDLRGPSLTIRTGCSASLICLNEACAAISKGDCNAAIVGGTNLLLAPGLTAAMAKQGVLSPSASCKTFSADADGYARAEGIAAIYIKPLKDALIDGNPVRAIVRGIGTNHGGKTAGMTHPSCDAQEELIRNTYELADISDFSKTAFIEAHGTGTPTGDPIEARAIARVFGESGIYMTSIKPNLGHTEGASGLVSLIKCVMSLEHRMIPPNIKFSRPNPKIPFDSGRLVVPTEAIPWPKSCLKRVSLNSFGLGGSNAHAIIETAPDFAKNPNARFSDEQLTESHLLLYSANSADSLKQVIKINGSYLSLHRERRLDLAHTLANGRQHMPHRTFAIARGDGTTEIASLTKIAASNINLIMTFTGQGAQWPQMGHDLMQWNSTFRDCIRSMDQFLRGLKHAAPSWSLEAELCRSSPSCRLYEAAIAHPTLTAIQVALVETLATFGIKPAAVVGHSGGEVAAAFAAGALTANEAIAVSLIRGASVANQAKRGAMAAIGMGWKETSQYLLPGAIIACDNSPLSVTISGDADQVLAVVTNINAAVPHVLTKVLDVDKAYHSPHMIEVGDNYLEALSGFAFQQRFQKPFFSSVTGKVFHEGEVLNPKYWQQNLESPVLFRTAINCILNHSLGQDPVFLEVGPHSALQGPLRQTLAQNSRTAPYASLMLRRKNCVDTFLAAIGQLFTLNVKIDFRNLVPDGRLLPDLPPYPWDHKSSYWHESRSVREWRLRSNPHHDLLGVRITESTDFEPAWKNFLHLDNAPWLRDHVINDDIIFPMAGYIGVAGEALRQIDNAEEGFRLRRVFVTTALVLHEGDPTEMITTFRRQRLTSSLESDWWEFIITSHSGHSWIRHCQGEITRLSSNPKQQVEQLILPRKASSKKWYSAMYKKGFQYGPFFQSLSDIRTATHGPRVASATICKHRRDDDTEYHMHPTVIDSVLQLLFCADNYGLCRSYRKLLPTVIESMEISRCAHDVRASVSTAPTAGTGIVGKGECMLGDRVVMKMRGLRLSPLEDVNDHGQADDHAAARQTWGPHIDFMCLESLIRPNPAPTDVLTSLNELAELCMVRARSSVAGLDSTCHQLPAFTKWIDHQIAGSQEASLETESGSCVANLIAHIRTNLAQTPAADTASAIYRLATSVREILTGTIQSLDLLREDSLLQGLYPPDSCDTSLFFKHLAHSKPNMRILEVEAGIGLGSKTNLTHLVLPNGQTSYSNYTVTSSSSTMLAMAEDAVKNIPNIEFKSLNICQDLRDQGFDRQKYDLIIMRNLSFASASSELALTNARILLNGNGKLLIHEEGQPKWMNYLQNFLSGWQNLPSNVADDALNLSKEQWTAKLESAGFTTPDIVVYKGSVFPRSHKVIVTSLSRDSRLEKNISLVSNVQNGLQPLVDHLSMKGFSVARFNLGESLPTGQDMIIALDETKPFFANIDKVAYGKFKDLLNAATDARITWVTRPCHMRCTDPGYAQIIGVARTVRSEMLIDFATCETSNTDKDAAIISDLFTWRHSQNSHDVLGPDTEFAICDGVVNVGRIYPFSLSDELLTEDKSKDFTLKLSEKRRHAPLQWTAKPPSALEGDQVDVVVHAVGLNFVDVLTRMGVVELAEPTLGHEASGVVRSVGPNVTNLRVGDRVMLLGRSTFSTSIVISELLCAKIPDELSFVDAATMPIVYGTVIQALVTVGQLEKGQSVLIHSGCGGVGLAAIQIAQMIGAEIFVTVSTQEKINFLMDRMHIPRKRIFNSRDESFVDGIFQETEGRGVDLALNSLSGELLHATWRCIAEFGTMLEIGKRDLIGAGKLDMDVFLANRSYCCVDLDQISARKPLIINRLLNSMVQFFKCGKIKPISPLHVFGPDKVQDAFTFMQPGSHIGKVVVEIPQPFLSLRNDRGLEVIRKKIEAKFDGSASYLLVGGLGGLGRAIAVWMAERGARHLVFLSPSAGTQPTHADLAHDLESMGSSVQMIQGSVTDVEDVKKALNIATKFGPIKGILQMSMVLRDQSFSDMSLDDWNQATWPKVKGTWNLHDQLISMRAEVDFVVLFSSITGIIGQPGQANYSSANTFLDSFVNYRTGLGLPVSSINLGAVEEIGFVSENVEVDRKFSAMALHRVSEQSLLDAVGLAIRVGKQEGYADPSEIFSVNRRSFVLGLASTTPINEDSNATLWKDLRMAAYHNNVENPSRSIAGSDDMLTTFLASAKANSSVLSAPETCTYFAKEIGKKLFNLLLKPAEELDTELSLSALGMDSLVAIEVRAWWRHTFGFDVTVLEMLQMGTLHALGKYVADKLGKV